MSSPSTRKLRIAIPFACGLVFALGLGVAGMTKPSKVLGFLDVTGSWDPSLAFVMAAALGIDLFLFARILQREQPVLEAAFDLPKKKAIDARLVAGAAVFGVGWGLAGYCPGPAVVSLVNGGNVVAFFGAMLFGIVVVDWVDRSRAS